MSNRLTDLDPRWVGHFGAGRSVGEKLYLGLSFLCPHCRVERLAVMFSNPVNENVIMPSWGLPGGHLWNRTGDDFENLSLTPSIDASAAGHWHGFITNGEIS